MNMKKALWKLIFKNVYLLYFHEDYVIVGNELACVGNSEQNMLTTFKDALRSNDKHKRHHGKVRRKLRDIQITCLTLI